MAGGAGAIDEVDMMVCFMDGALDELGESTAAAAAAAPARSRRRSDRLVLVDAYPGGTDVGGRGAVGVVDPDCRNEREVFIRRGGCGLVPRSNEDEVFWLASDGRFRRPNTGWDCEGDL